MSNINKIYVGNTTPDNILYNTYVTQSSNQNITFGSIIPKDNSMTAVTTVSNSVWQINDDWEIEIISPKQIAIKKFKIDSWGLRQIIPAPHTGYDNFKLKVTGLNYVHENIICHTPGSSVPDGFTKAYCGTNGWNVYWYPGQFTSGNYIQGLGIQFGVVYTANDNERDDSLQMGKYPWDIGNRTIITDGTFTGTWGDNNFKAFTIGLFGGVQNASSWHDESGDAYKKYDISNNPIIIDIDIPDLTKPIDVSSIECWDVFNGTINTYHKDKTIENCWEKYGFVSTGQKDTYYFYKIDMKGISNEITNPILPTVIDLEEHILPQNKSGIKGITWNHKIYNTDFWTTIQNYLQEHPIICVSPILDDNLSNYTAEDNNQNLLYNKWFNESGMTGHLTLKFDGRFTFDTFPENFNGTDLDKLTLQFLQDNISLSVLQRFFRGSKIKEIEILDKNGNKSNKFLKAFDLSGMCEFSVTPEIFPDIIDWTGRSGDGASNIGYMFSYVSNITELSQSGNTRDSEENTILINFADQAFQQCKNLIKIGPILNISRLDSSKIFAIFQGCSKLEDVLIKGLNGSSADFTSDGKLGIVPSLNQSSIEYLINNSIDLTKFDENTTPQKASNSWTYKENENYVWITNDSFWVSNLNQNNEEQRYRDSTTISNIRRLSETSTDSFLYITSTISTNITISGLQNNDILIWKNETEEITLNNGTNDISCNSTGKFILKRSGSTETIDDKENIVYIKFTKPYSSTAPKAQSGEIHCPENWRDKLTPELLITANSKNWSIFINDEELIPSNVSILFTDGSKVNVMGIGENSYSVDNVVGFIIKDQKKTIIMNPTISSERHYFCGGGIKCDDYELWPDSSLTSQALNDLNGLKNTNILTTTLTLSNWAVNVARSTTWNDGRTGYLMSMGESEIITNNLIDVNKARIACGLEEINTSNYYWTSTLNAKAEDGSILSSWIINFNKSYQGHNVQGVQYVTSIDEYSEN